MGDYSLRIDNCKRLLVSDSQSILQLSTIRAQTSLLQFDASNNLKVAVATLESKIDILNLLLASKLTVALFQANPATGTMYNVSYLNDNNTATSCYPESVGKYFEVDFGDIYALQKWRQYGGAMGNVGTTFDVEYWDVLNNAWVSWFSFACKSTSGWSSFELEGVVFTDKIKVTCTNLVGTPEQQAIYEMEFIF